MSSLVPEPRVNRNGHVVTKHVNPNKRPVDSFQRGLQSLAHFVARTSFDGKSHTETTVDDDPVGVLLDNPSHIVLLNVNDKNRHRFSGAESIAIALSTGTVMVSTTHSRRTADIAADFVAHERTNDNPALIARYLTENADRLNKKLEKKNSKIRLVASGDSLKIIQMAPVRESIKDFETWDDIYGIAAEKDLLATKQNVEIGKATEAIRTFIKTSKRFNPYRFRK